MTEIYINKAGQTIGQIVKTIPITNHRTNVCVLWHTVDIPVIGEFTVSQDDDLDYERIKAIAEYEKSCIEGRVLEVQDEIEELQKEVAGLNGRIEAIDREVERFGAATHS